MKKIALVWIPIWVFFSLAAAGVFPAQREQREDSGSQEKKEDSSPARAQRPHTVRAIVEASAVLAASTIGYWSIYSDFREDWQFDFICEDQFRRFFSEESPCLDSNSFWHNWSHAMSGAAYYNMGRTNGLSNRASFLFSLGTSIIWECASEWREVISINDLLFTSFGGPSMGEPLFQIGSVFSHREGLRNRLAGFIFNPALAVNNWFDRKEGVAANSAPEASWHRFRMFAGSRNNSLGPKTESSPGMKPADGGGHSHRFLLGLNMETNAAPGYGKSGEAAGFVPDSLAARFFLEFDFGRGGLEELSIRTQAVLFGFCWQSVHENPQGSLRGYVASIGAGSAFEYYRKRPVAWYDGIARTEDGKIDPTSDARFQRPAPTEFMDKLGAVSILGPVFEIGLFKWPLHARWTSEAYFDFAAVNALAYNRYTEDHDTSGVKSTLLNWGYYYAFGISLASALDLDWRGWNVRGAFRYRTYKSIQGLDRFQFLDVVTDDFPIYDSRLVLRGRLGWRLPGTPIELGVTAERINRRGRILDFRERSLETRISWLFNLIF